jgi:hypothetical protein
MLEAHPVQRRQTMATKIISGSALALEIEGKAAGALRSLQPPGYSFDPGSTRLEAGDITVAGEIAITPMDAEFDLAVAAPLLDWALSLARRNSQAPSGAALVLDANFKVRRRIEWTEGLLTEVRFPVLDASAKSPFTVGLAWQPASIAQGKATGDIVGPGPGKRKSLMVSNFRVQGLPFDTKFTSRVTLPTVRGKVAAETYGSSRRTGRHYASVDDGEISIEVAASSASAARDWVQAVAADGRVTDPELLNFSIEMLDPSLKNVLAAITLNGCSLAGYAEDRIESASERSAGVKLRFTIGLFDIKVAA